MNLLLSLVTARTISAVVWPLMEYWKNLRGDGIHKTPYSYHLRFIIKDVMCVNRNRLALSGFHLFNRASSSEPYGFCGLSTQEITNRLTVKGLEHCGVHPVRGLFNKCSNICYPSQSFKPSNQSNRVRYADEMDGTSTLWTRNQIRKASGKDKFTSPIRFISNRLDLEGCVLDDRSRW